MPVFRQFLVLLFLACTLPASAQIKAGLICLTNAQQVRELKPDDAQKNLPVRLRGVITYYDPPHYNLFLQDATAGIFVLMDSNLSTTITAGQEVELEAVTSKGDFAPILRSPGIRVLGQGQLPVARRVSFNQLATGLEDSQWVEVSGFVRSATESDDRHYLSLLMDGQRLTVSVGGLNESEAAALVNTRSRFRGVCYSRYNMKRQLRSPWIAVSSRAEVAVEETGCNAAGRNR